MYVEPSDCDGMAVDSQSSGLDGCRHRVAFQSLVDGAGRLFLQASKNILENRVGLGIVDQYDGGYFCFILLGKKRRSPLSTFLIRVFTSVGQRHLCCTPGLPSWRQAAWSTSRSINESSTVALHRHRTSSFAILYKVTAAF
jgi:hypothetical protein